MYKSHSSFLFGIILICIIVHGCTKDSDPAGPNQSTGSIGSVVVTSSPPGALIILDNASMEKITPDTLRNVTAGSHSIKLTLSNYADTSFAVNIIANQTAAVSVTLRALESKYAGTWNGTTSQNLPLYFHITKLGIIDSVNARLRMSFGTFTCTANFSAGNKNVVANDTFNIFLSIPIANVTTRLRGTFSSATSVTGTYSKFSDSYFVICGGMLSMGTAGTIISAGTFNATKSSLKSSPKIYISDEEIYSKEQTGPE
jgi:hypothetical protein